MNEGILGNVVLGGGGGDDNAQHPRVRSCTLQMEMKKRSTRSSHNDKRAKWMENGFEVTLSLTIEFENTDAAMATRKRSCSVSFVCLFGLVVRDLGSRHCLSSNQSMNRTILITADVCITALVQWRPGGGGGGDGALLQPRNPCSH